MHLMHAWQLSLRCDPTNDDSRRWKVDQLVSWHFTVASSSSSLCTESYHFSMISPPTSHRSVVADTSSCSFRSSLDWLLVDKLFIGCWKRSASCEWFSVEVDFTWSSSVCLLIWCPNHDCEHRFDCKIMQINFEGSSSISIQLCKETIGKIRGRSKISQSSDHRLLQDSPLCVTISTLRLILNLCRVSREYSDDNNTTHKKQPRNLLHYFSAATHDAFPEVSAATTQQHSVALCGEAERKKRRGKS